MARWIVSIYVLSAALGAIYPIGGFSAASQAAPVLRAVSGMERVGPWDPVQGAPISHIYAARNEWEPFQVVISARGGAVTVEDVALSPFIGPDGAGIDSANLYVEHYVQVNVSSPYSPNPPGLYPDPLIPIADPYSGVPLDGAVYDAVPFDLADGENRVVWVDVYIPADAAPGEYWARFSVTWGGGQQVEMPVALTVWDFELPQVPSLRSAFGMAYWHLSDEYDLGGYDGVEEAAWLARRYYDMLLDHRLMPYNEEDTMPTISSPGELDFGRYYHGLGTALENLEYYFEDRGVRAYQLPLWSTWPFGDPLGEDRKALFEYVMAYLRFFHERGWDEYLYAYVLDEPGSAEEYALAREWGEFFDEVETSTGLTIPFLLTEQPVPEDPAWGDLIGYVDIWVPCCNTIWEDEEFWGTHVVSERMAAGDEVWWYTAMAQFGDAWLELHGWPDTVADGEHPPVWLLDYSPMDYRIAGWLAALYGLGGVMYWETLYWHETPDPWLDPGTFIYWGEVYNGDGMLIYPGRADEIGFDGPVASMRLKWIREGMEDYEYLALLERLYPDDLDGLLHRVIRNEADWEADPTVVYDTRANVAGRIVGAE